MLIDYLQTSKTITGEYYCNLLDQLYVKMREKYLVYTRKTSSFIKKMHLLKMMAKITELQFGLLEHPLYAPDLVFQDKKGILLIDQLQTSKTITGEYYCNVLDQLYVNIREKTPGLQKKNIILHQNNAPAQKSILTMTKIIELQFGLLEHPLYAPDLAPFDFHLLPRLKRFLRGKHFPSHEEIIAAVKKYFKNLSENHFRDKIRELENYWKKCIELKGDYIEE